MSRIPTTMPSIKNLTYNFNCKNSLSEYNSRIRDMNGRSDIVGDTISSFYTCNDCGCIISSTNYTSDTFCPKCGNANQRRHRTMSGSLIARIADIRTKVLEFIQSKHEENIVAMAA